MGNNNERMFGYARVSSRSQNADRQKDALLLYGVPERDIYIDKASGKSFERPEYLNMKRQLHKGDTVVILDLDRLGRNYDEMAEEWKDITKTRECDIVVINYPLLSTLDRSKNNTEDKGWDLDKRFIADMIFGLLSYVAERERKSIRERQREGIESAKRNGVVFGRPQIQIPDHFNCTYEKVLKRQITNREAMETLGLKNNTYYKFAQQYRKENGLV